MVDVYEDMKRKHGCDFLFFCPGGFHPTKNIPRLIRAFAKIKTNRNYKAIIAGNGTLKGYARRYIEESGLGGKMLLVGFLSDVDLVSYYNSADIIVYLPINEPFGLVPVEAMACGKPSLVSATGGTAETIVDKKTGFLVDPLNVEEIANKIQYVLDHVETLRDMAHSCKERYLSMFTLEIGVNRLIAALEPEKFHVQG